MARYDGRFNRRSSSGRLGDCTLERDHGSGVGVRLLHSSGTAGALEGMAGRRFSPGTCPARRLWLDTGRLRVACGRCLLAVVREPSRRRSCLGHRRDRTDERCGDGQHDQAAFSHAVRSLRFDVAIACFSGYRGSGAHCCGDCPGWAAILAHSFGVRLGCRLCVVSSCLQKPIAPTTRYGLSELRRPQRAFEVSATLRTLRYVTVLQVLHT